MRLGQAHWFEIDVGGSSALVSSAVPELDTVLAAIGRQLDGRPTSGRLLVGASTWQQPADGEHSEEVVFGSALMSLYDGDCVCLLRTRSVDELIVTVQRLLASYPTVEPSRPTLRARVVERPDGSALLAGPREMRSIVNFRKELGRLGWALLPDRVVVIDDDHTVTTLDGQVRLVTAVLVDPSQMLGSVFSVAGTVDQMLSTAFLPASQEALDDQIRALSGLVQSSDVQVHGISGNAERTFFPKFKQRFSR